MGSRLFCIFQNYFLEKQRESCGVQYKAKKRSVKGMKKMTIFEYLYVDVYYTDEYGNAYFDSCVDIDYELDEIPEIVNLGDHTYFMAKEDLDLYNQYDIRVDGVSEDDLRFLHYTRRPYYQMRGRSVSREQNPVEKIESLKEEISEMSENFPRSAAAYMTSANKALTTAQHEYEKNERNLEVADRSAS